MQQTDLLRYLDESIRYWRGDAQEVPQPDTRLKALHFAEAFESVRKAILHGIGEKSPLCWWDVDLVSTTCPKHQISIGHCPVKQGPRIPTPDGA